MGKSGAPVTYYLDNVWPIFWFCATLPFRLFVLTWFGLAVLAQTLLTTSLVLLSVGPISVFLIAGGSLTMSMQADQQKFYDAAGDLGEAIEDVANTLIDLVQVLLDCKESLVQLWNDVWRFIAAIIHLVYEALDDIFNFGLPQDLFYWARSAARLEAELRKEAELAELERLTDLFETEISNRTRTIEPDKRAAYLDMMRRRMHRMARAQVIGKNTVEASLRILNLPQVLCNVLDSIFEFLIELLDIIDDFVLGLLDALLSVFDVFTGDFEESFLVSFVKYILVAVLQEIPFTGCFVNPDDLPGKTVEEIGDLIIAQVAQRLVSCLCGYRYKNAIGILPMLATNPGGDDVPSNIGAAIVGCFCFIPGVTITADSDPIDLIIRCTGIDKLIAAFEGFVDLLRSVYEPAIEWLKKVVNETIDWVEDLIDKVGGLLRQQQAIIEDRMANGGARSARSLQMLEGTKVTIEDLLVQLEGLKGRVRAVRDMEKPLLFRILDGEIDSRSFSDVFAAELRQQMTNATYVGTMETHAWTRLARETMRPNMQAFAGALLRIRQGALNMTETLRDDPMDERVKRAFRQAIEDLPDSSPVRRAQAYFEEAYGPENRQYVTRLVDVLRNGTRLAGWALRASPKSREVYERLRAEVDMKGAVRSVFTLGRASRERRMARAAADPEADPVEAGCGCSRSRRQLETFGKTVVHSLINPENVPRTIELLEQKYGTVGKRDPAMQAGLRNAMEKLPHGFQRAGGSEPLRAVLQRYGLEDSDLDRLHAEALERNEARGKRQAAREAEVFSVATYAGQAWDTYRNQITAALQYEADPEAMPGQRVIVVSLAIAGGGAAALISVGGFAIGAGLTVLGTLLVGLLVPLLLVVVLFLFTVLQFVIHAGTGIISNTFRADGDPGSFDIVTPILLVVVDLVAASFTNGYVLSDLQSAIGDIGDIALDDLQYTGAFVIRDFLCAIPIKIPPYTCPRYPLVDEDGRPTESIPDWLFDAVLFFPQDEPCFHSGWCGGGDCVCPGNPSRLGTPSAPCQTIGFCNGWPLIRPRIGIENLEVNVDLQPECENVFRIDLQRLRYFEDPDFIELGFSWGWLTSAGFRNFIGEVFNVGYELVRFLTVRLFIGMYVKWSGAFAGVAGALWFIPAFPLQIIAYVTVLGNTLSGPLRDVGVFVLRTATENQGLPLIGGLLGELTYWGRFDNWQDHPPFGEASNAQWLCLVGNAPSLAIFSGVLLAALGLVVGFLLGGGIVWLFFVFFDVLLFPVNLAILILRIQYANVKLARRKILLNSWLRTKPAASTLAASPAKAAGGFGGRKACIRESAHTERGGWWLGRHPHAGASFEDVEAHGLRQPLERVGLAKRLAGVPHVEIGGLRVARLAPDDDGPRRVDPGAQPPMPLEVAGAFVRDVGLATLATVRAMGTVYSPSGLRRVWRHGPLRTMGMYEGPKAEAAAPVASRYVVFDHLVPEAHYPEFPLALYLHDPYGAPLLEDPDVAVFSPDLAPRYVPADEHTASYRHVVRGTL